MLGRGIHVRGVRSHVEEDVLQETEEVVERLHVVLLQVILNIKILSINIDFFFLIRSDSEPSPTPTTSSLVKSIENMKVSTKSSSDDSLHSNIQSMPRPIRKSILKQNVKFLHNR